MVYDADPITCAWFDAALSASEPRVRWRAVALLRDVGGPFSDRWLDLAERDPDPRVAATAVLVKAALAADDSARDDDLFESDFASGVEASGLAWEWEYRVVVCDGLYVPSFGVLVWTRVEDDAAAKRFALLKAHAERSSGPDGSVPLIVQKRFVNRYTRSARSFAEAMRWHRAGRPRYDESGEPRT